MRLRELLFSHAEPIIRLGRYRPVTPDDMLPFDPRLDPWDAEQQLQRIQLSTPWRMLWSSFWAAGAPSRRAVVIALVRLPIVLASPLLLRWLLDLFAHLPLDPSLLLPSLAVGVSVALSVALDGIVVQHYYYNGLWAYARISGGLNMRIYRHALQLDRRGLAHRHTGDIVNHMASDTEGIAELSFVVPEVLSSLLLIACSFVLLWTFLGAAAVVAFGSMLLLVPLAHAAARRFARTDDQLWQLRDRRVSLVSQILSAIRLVKYFAWERSIEQEIADTRTKELRAAAHLVRNEALSTVLFLASTMVVALVGFGAYVLLGGTLSPAVVFPTLLLLGQLEGPVGHLPHFIKNTAHAYVAAERLKEFFDLPVQTAKPSQPPCAEPPAVTIERLRVRYGDSTVLDNCTLTIGAGEAIALVGPVGSGKTSLLLALLGEVPIEGTIAFRTSSGKPCTPKIAYVAQEPFILNATAGENIAFGRTLDEHTLRSLIFDAALDEDIRQFPAGLDTEIGERGITVSGGQKMRIALARAAAAEPTLVLLDDPLAAVDTRTEALLIERLLFGRWHNITRIVTTHRLEHLPRFDRIVVLGEGTIEAVGTYEELLRTSERFRALIAEHRKAHTPTQTPRAEQTKDSHLPAQSNGKLTEEEDRSVGVVKAELFWYYLRLFGGERPLATAAILTGMALLAIAIVALPILQSLWLGWNVSQPRHPVEVLSVFGILGLGILAAHYAERRVWMERALVASRRIHARLLHAVLRAPLRLFDTTPSGRILNRFARDIQAIDDELAWNFESAVRSFASMLGTIVLITVVAPLVLLISAPALVVYYRVQRDYRRVAREAKRFESIARSPRYALFKETLHGLLTIRAFGQQSAFMDRFTNALRHYLRMYWSNILINRWFSTRAPIVSSVIALATVIVLVFGVAQGAISTGVAGVVLTYTITFWGNLNWCVRAFSEVESRMTSLERVHALASVSPEPAVTCTPALPSDAPWIDTPRINGSHRIGADIVFDHVWVRYAPNLPWVLRDVSFRIEPGMHVGIVGRTGSGKTTLLQTLFRFVEPERGRVLIGGIEHCRIPLERLRSALSIVPQDPILLLGTVRTNLDRWGRYSDAALWRVLEQVTLAETIAQLGGLDAPIGEHGGNLSQGQRQLLCLARALLVGATVIVLDEATASIDVESDAAIRRTLAEHCRGITVLTIAHRPASVADADMIIELDSGTIARIRTQKELCRC
ncbi:MAG: ABC transporter transmembrane domain-containing protein [Bacteroidota bacterium]|nr:ABC transporter transmembrane domain-containing protein [Bacteroidota bacterium]